MCNGPKSPNPTLAHMRDCIIEVSEKNAIPQLPDELIRIIMRFKYNNFIASLPPMKRNWVLTADTDMISWSRAQSSRTAVEERQKAIAQHKASYFMLMFFACVATVLLLYGGGVIG